MVFESLQHGIRQINYDLLILRIHNVLLLTGLIPITLFSTITARQLGYSATTVGSVFSALPLATIVIKPTLCSIADKFQLRRTIFLLSLFGILLANAFMIWLPPRQIQPSDVLFRCNSRIIVSSLTECLNSSGGFIDEQVNCELHCRKNEIIERILCATWKLEEYCEENRTTSLNELINFNCIMSSRLLKDENFVYSEIISAALINPSTGNETYKFKQCTTADSAFELNCKMECEETIITEAFGDPASNPVIISWPFWCLVLTLALESLSASVNLSMTDTICFKILGKYQHKYGTVRLWGTVGYGLSGGLCGLLADRLSVSGKRKNYTPLYLFSIVVITSDILVSLFIQIKQEHKPKTVFKGIIKIFRNIRTIIFILACIYVAMVLNIMWIFLYWYLEDISSKEELKWSTTIQGLDGLVNAIFSEVPVMIFAGRIIRKFGFEVTTATVFLTLAFRFALYGLLKQAVWVLPIELTSGFCYGMMLVIMTTYANEVAPTGLEATTQSIFSVCFDGIGTSLGGVIGGLMYERWGGRVMFYILAAMSLMVFFIFSIIQYLIYFISKNRNANLNVS